MSKSSRRLAGILLIVYPTVMWGGVSLLSLLLNDPAYTANELRQSLWRAGHAHAGIMLLLALVTIRYVDDAVLSPGWGFVAKHFIPYAAILMPAGFFLSVLSPEATEPNVLIYLVYAGAIFFGLGVLTLGVGLIRGTDSVSTMSSKGRHQ